MNILLIYPRLNYPSKAAVSPPLGILYIASVLRQAGHRVSFLDLTNLAEMPDLEPYLKDVGLLGISITSAIAFRAFEVLREAKRLRPDLFCVAGGPHATALPEETLRVPPAGGKGFNAVVIGEGEETVVEVARAVEEKKSIRKIAGIAFLRKGKMIVTAPRSFIKDLDRLPEPARDLVDWPAYYSRTAPFDSVIASRGCPHRCLFCKPMQEKLFGKKIRYRSPGNITGEIGHYQALWKKHSPLASQGIPFFAMFVDDMFFSSRTWVDSFCDDLEKSGLAIWWGCQARVDAIGEAQVKRMFDCGCRLVAFGVESGSQKVLEYLRKDITPLDTKKAFEICRNIGIGTHAYIMIGSPEETPEDLQATYKLIEEIRPTTCYVARATPQPGSYLYDLTKEQGILNLRRFDEHFDYYYTRMPIRLSHLTESDLDEFEEKVNALFLNAVKLRGNSGRA